MKRVLEYKVQHVAPKAAEHQIDGVMAAAAFGRFDAGLDGADVVKELQITPRSRAHSNASG